MNNDVIRHAVREFVSLGIDEELAKKCALLYLKGKLVSAWATLDYERGTTYPKPKDGGVDYMKKIESWIKELEAT